MFSSDKWFGASAEFYPETINQSLRFEDGDNSRLSTTWGSAGNRKIWTLSWWMKRSNLGEKTIFSSPKSASENGFTVYFPDDKLEIFEYRNTSRTSTFGATTDMVFRDTTNWYHCVIYWQTDTYSSDADSVRLYVNGTQVNLNFRNDGVGADYESVWWNNSSYTQYIGGQRANSQNFDGYIAEVNFIDGQALTADSFGETKNGVWIPKAYTGSYGTNGFRFTFANSSALGDDTSGNGNDFTSSGLASTDVCTDSPTNNFCTLNHLQQRSNSSATFSEGNLKVVGASASVSGIMTGTFGVSSGKWYWEVRASGSAQYSNTGIVRTPFDPTSTGDSGILSNEYVYVFSGVKYNNNSSASYGASYTSGDIIGVALDLDGDTLTFYKNGSSQGVAYSSLPSGTYLPVFDCYNSSSWILNAGQEGTFVGNETAGGNSDGNGVGNFKYSVPSGHLALCSSNLPDTTLSPNQSEQADDHFNTVLYTGNGTSQSITGVGFQPDWVWAKTRNDGSLWHFLLDSSRGGTNRLYSNGTGAESSSVNNITSFDSDGFSVGSAVNLNKSSEPIVAWNWKANGGTTSSNTDGSITSTVQASTKAGFSIVTYTGTGANATIGHGLGIAPQMAWVKRRDSADNWVVYYNVDGLGAGVRYLLLNGTGASVYDTTYWNSSTATSTVINLGTAGSVNTSSGTYVCYTFANIEGYSKIGTYTGNGATDGTFIYLGFRPAWFLLKRTDSTGNWLLYDNKRDPDNRVAQGLFPNTSGAESEQTGGFVDFVSNGVKLKEDGSAMNASSGTFIYMAFAEQPFKFSNAR